MLGRKSCPTPSGMASALWNRRGLDGLITERIPPPSDCCSIRQDPETGQYFYDYSVDGVFRTFTGYELSFLFFESYDGIRGRGFLNLARETIGAEGRRPAVRPEILPERGR